MLDYRINTFLDLCKTMNYRLTAENLSMTQPGVTQHIHYLENYYGCKLFVYDRRTLTMTDEAVRIKHHMENITYQERKLRLSLGNPSIHFIHIGVTKTIGDFVIGDHISRYLSEARNRISVKVFNTEELLELLRSGELDFAVIEGFFNQLEFASKKYRTEPFLGLCGKQHPFAGRSVSTEELLGANLLLREEGSGTRKLLEGVLESKNLSLNMFSQITTTNSFSLISNLLEQNAGITFAYEAVLQKNPLLTTFDYGDLPVHHDFMYIYLPNSEAEKLVDHFDEYR